MKSVEMLVFWARLWPLLAALLLALPGAGGGAAYVFCHGMGRVVDACCCPSSATATPSALPPSCGAKAQPRGCCERIERASASVAAASREKAGVGGFLPALVEAAPVFVQRSKSSERFAALEPIEARAPRPRGPPLFIAHCSFLT